MADEKQEQAEQPAATALLRIDGWVKYCEYFHLLDADMQATAQLSAQRYDKNCDYHRSSCGGGPSLEPREHDICFQHIARAVEQHDKPLALGAETDLAAVHERLRAAAHSSNLRAAAAAEKLDVTKDAEGLLRSAKPKKRSQQGSSATAAAMETHLCFGLALGESGEGAPPVPDAERKQAPSRPEFTFDWCAAMSEAGLSDEFEANEALEALEVVQVADEAVRAIGLQAAEAAAAAEAEAEEAEAAKEADAAAEASESRRLPAHAAIDDRFDSQSEAGSDDSLSAASADGGAAGEADADEADADASGAADGATRRSRRAPKAPREWTSLQSAPLLKLEKLKQQPKPQRSGSKRSADYETDSCSEELATPKTHVGVGDDLRPFYVAPLPGQLASPNKRQR